MSVFTRKVFNEKRDRVFLSIVACTAVLYIAFSCTYFASAAQTVKDDVVRLHILANSDNSVDQKTKLCVRDAILEKNTLLLTEGVTVDNAMLYFEKSKDELLKTAEKTLKENGCDYGVSISLGKEYFETRQYDGLTFPAGEYTALKVVLGKGEGHNWWCVMFPPLCVPAADGIDVKNEETSEFLTESGNNIVNNGKKYKIKFKILEIYEELKNSFTK